MIGAGLRALRRSRLWRTLRPVWKRWGAPVATAARQRFWLEAARLHRRRLRHTVFIGVTGSTGKTTAKELIAAVLGTRLSGHKNWSSRNILRGITPTILGTRPGDRFCVQELGIGGLARSPLAWQRALDLLRPEIGVVTNVGSDHLSLFRTPDAIAAVKGELVAALPAHGTAILNADDPRVLAMKSRCAGRVITYGLTANVTLRADDVRSAWPERLTFTVRYGDQTWPVSTQLCGTHWVPSVLAALAVGVAMDIPLGAAVEAVAAVPPYLGRMSPITHPDGVTFIRDDWKAPIGTIAPALGFMRDTRATRKIVVIGTISDYAGDSTSKYTKIARQALEVADRVVFIGPWATRALRAKRHRHDDAVRAFGTVKDAVDHLKDFWRPGDLVLLKGSVPADHLARIALTRTTQVECWLSRCARDLLCDSCRLLRVPANAERGGSGRARAEPAVDLKLLTNGAAPGAPAQAVLGLGNPGDEYRDTPHNVGQRALDQLARTLGLTWEGHGRTTIARGQWQGETVYLVKPLTSVNASGPLLAEFARGLSLEPADCVVVHDDLDLPLGTVRERLHGSAGGHKGVGSILEAFQSDELRRVKIGVGRPERKVDTRAHVLTAFSAAELPVVERACEEAARRALKLIASRPAHTFPQPTT